MANLLSQERIRTLRREYILNLVAAVSIALTLAGCVAALALASSYMYTKMIQRALAAEAETLSMDVDEEQRRVRDDMADTRRRIRAVNLIAESPHMPSDAIRAVVETAPALGVYVVRLEYVRSGDAGSLRISGTLSRQEQLSAFSSALQSEPVFSAVEVPLSSFAHTAGGTFTVVARGSF